MMMKKMKWILVLCIGLLIHGATSFAAFPISNKQSLIVVDMSSSNSEQVTVSETANKESYDAPVKSDELFDMGSGNNQFIAFLLCLFLGVFGIHRFYLGYTTIGLIQLFTGGIFAIWTIIDLVRIAIGDLRPWRGKYVR